MSQMGQTEKNSVRAHVFRFALELGHCSTQSAYLKRADSVAKVFLHLGTEILRAVGAAIEYSAGYVKPPKRINVDESPPAWRAFCRDQSRCAVSTLEPAGAD
jgi:hypothetical protein